jgi:hypothetical protein
MKISIQTSNKDDVIHVAIWQNYKKILSGMYLSKDIDSVETLLETLLEDLRNSEVNSK